MEMKRFLGNIARTFLATGALSVSAFAGADDANMSGCTVAPGCNTCCCGQPCCEPPVCGWAYNPPGYCRCNNAPNACNECWSDGLTARVDFLWWRAEVTNAEFGVEEATTTVVNNGQSGGASRETVLNNEHVKGLDFKYEPGFRLGLYNACAAGCWDLGLVWTHFHSKTSESGYSDHSQLEINGTDLNFYPFWNRTTGVGAPDTAEGRYSIDMDLIDLEFGRKFYVSNCFVVRPHFGLRGARLNQSYRIEAMRDVPAPTGLGEAYSLDGRLRNDFLAIGPRLGFEAQIHLGCGVSLFGDVAGSLVFGRFSRHSYQDYTDMIVPTSIGTTAIINAYDYETGGNILRSTRAFTDMAVGVKWERCFEWCNRFHPVGVAFAWEQHAFFNVNNFDTIVNAYDPVTNTFVSDLGLGVAGDLYTQGLTVSVTFGF
ncbi:MAG: Lpg1974 family pore-forming outer membrane protein [Parachlamydiaceae bacterium]